MQHMLLLSTVTLSAALMSNRSYFSLQIQFDLKRCGIRWLQLQVAKVGDA